jgi:hypothetical protein
MCVIVANIMEQCPLFLPLQRGIIIIIIMLPNQAIASTPSAPRPSGAEGRGKKPNI